MEREFRKSYFENSLIQMRLAILLGIFIYGTFTFLDKALAPEVFHEFLIIRFLFVIPFMIFVFGFSFFSSFRKYYQILNIFIFLLAGTGLITMATVAEKFDHTLISRLYFLSIILVYIFGYTLLKLRFLWSTISGWILFFIFAVFIYFILDFSDALSVSLLSVVLSANILSSASSYLYELSVRKNFFSSRQLMYERKKVQRMNSELEKKVRQRTSQLEVAKERAEESDRLKSAFLTNMSHEIRTPMNGILGFTEILASEGVDEDKKKKFIRVINDRANHLMELLNNLIDISLIESKQLKFNYEQIELNPFMHRLYDFFSSIFINSDVEFMLQLERENEDILIETDQTKLEQILSNLISNAAKFTTEGYVKLGYTFLEDKLRFYVEDTGPGIPPGA